MFLTRVTAVLVTLIVAVLALPKRAAWPNGPFNTNGPNIVDASGNKVTYAGVNWPGAADVMIPEGLQYSSIADVVSKIKSLSLNAVRLTYAIEMVDDILDNGGDVTLKNALSKALGATNGTKVLNQILAKNPSFTAQTTRLQVFDAVAKELARQQVYILLDNHMSRGAWCCGSTDGNTWFGDTDFDTTRWKRGVAYMAKHASSWTALTAVSLRNELRQPSNNAAVSQTYGWPVWYDNVVAAAGDVHNANPNTLILLSGLNYDTTLQPITAGTDLGNGKKFNLADFSYKQKLVFELHNYAGDTTSCSSLESSLYNGGYNAMDTSSTSTATNHAPVILTEFGFAQDDNSSNGVYAQCLKSYTTSNNYSFFQWVISGSYYIRSGVQDYEETWGLLNHNWSGWRSGAATSFTKPMAQGTLS